PDDDARRAVPLHARGRPAPLPADERQLPPRRGAGAAREGHTRQEGATPGARPRRHGRVARRAPAFSGQPRVSPRAGSATANDAPPPPPPSDVEEFLRHLAKERDVSPNTVLAYRRDLAEFVAFLGTYYGSGGWRWGSGDRLSMCGFLAPLHRTGA